MRKAAPEDLAARPRTTYLSITSLMSPRLTSRISGIALFDTILMEFSCASASSVLPSPTAKASKFQCATSGNSMCARIWGAYPLHKTGYRKSSLHAGCTGNVSPIREAGRSNRSHPQRRKPSALNSMHLGQWHLRSSLPDISKWPHLAQTNAPSERAIIGMNSWPTTQYGHRSTRSVIAAAPLAERLETKAQRPAPQGAILERRGSSGMLGITVSLLASNE
jgi:hypothetical protein